MSTKDKLIDRFKRLPNDFTWEELVRLFRLLGFEMNNKGKTSGSRTMFKNGEKVYFIHKPHPSSIIKESSMKQIFNYLSENDLI